MAADELRAVPAPREPSERESLLSLNRRINLCCPTTFSFPFVLLPLWFVKELTVSQQEFPILKVVVPIYALIRDLLSTRQGIQGGLQGEKS